MPDFFDPPQSTPDPSELLSTVHRNAHHRRVRRAITAAAAAAVVIAGGGIAVGASVADRGDGAGPSTVIQTSTPPPLPTTSTTPVVSPTPHRAMTSPTGHATGDSGQTDPVSQMIVTVLPAVTGYSVVLHTQASGRVPQVYDRRSGRPIPPRDMEPMGTRVDWGDGGPQDGSDAGDVKCEPDAKLVELPTFRTSYRHTYGKPGTYTIAYDVGACPSPGQTTGTVVKTASVTVQAAGPTPSQVSSVIDNTAVVGQPMKTLIPRGTAHTTTGRSGGLLTAWIGQRYSQYDQQHWETVFFWHNGSYVGWSNRHLAWRVLDVAPIANGFAVTVTTPRPQPDGLGARHRRLVIDFDWNGHRFAARQAIAAGVFTTETVQRIHN